MKLKRNPKVIDLQPKWDRSEFEVKPEVKQKWNRSGVEVRPRWILWVSPKRDRSEIAVEPKWGRCDITVISKLNQCEIEVRPKWSRSELEVRPKWNQSGNEVTSMWERSETEVRLKWNRQETDVEPRGDPWKWIPKRGRSEIESASNWDRNDIEENSKWTGTGTEVKSTWQRNRSETKTKTEHIVQSSRKRNDIDTQLNTWNRESLSPQASLSALKLWSYANNCHWKRSPKSLEPQIQFSWLLASGLASHESCVCDSCAHYGVW